MKKTLFLAAVSVAALFTSCGPKALVPADKGGFETGEYRNVFVEAGYSKKAVDAKLNEVFEEVFFGPDKVYFEVEDSLAYVSDVKNNDVRTEGMSYGMMVAVQMDRKDRLGLIGDFSGGGIYVDIERYRVDIAEDRRSTHAGDGTGGGKEGESAGDDFITGADIGFHQSDDQRIRTAGNADAVIDLAVSGGSFFKFHNFITEDKTLGIAHFFHNLHKFIFERLVLGHEIKQRYLHSKKSPILCFRLKPVYFNNIAQDSSTCSSCKAYIAMFCRIYCRNLTIRPLKCILLRANQPR